MNFLKEVDNMDNLKDLYRTMFTAYKDVVNVTQLAEMLDIGNFERRSYGNR